MQVNETKKVLKKMGVTDINHQNQIISEAMAQIIK